MPPPRYNPLSVSRARFLGEDYPETYFPRQPVGSGRTMTAPYISGNLAAESRLELDDILSKRDDQQTKLADNEYRRLELADRRRILPFSTEAQIASEKARRTEAEQDEYDSPFIHKDNQSIREAQGVKRQADLEDLPEARQYESAQRKAGIEAFESQDPYAARLQRFTKNPDHQLAYETFLGDDEAAKLPKSQRQQYAFEKSLRMARDEEGANAVEDAILDGTLKEEDRDRLLEPVVRNGMYLGRKIKDDADRNRLAGIIARQRNQKLRDAREKEERIAGKDYDYLQLRSLTELRDSAKEALRLRPDDAKAQAEMDDYTAQLKELMARPKVPPARIGPAGTPAAGAATAPDAEAPKKLAKPVTNSPWNK